MPFDVKAVLGVRFYQYCAAVTGSLGILSSEMHFGWPSPSLPILKNGTYFFQISDEEASWLAVMIFPGIVCGAIISSFIADMLGRKKVILGASIPLFVSWVTLALGRSQVIVFIARFLGGFGGGISFATVPMYLGEISDPQIRGFLSSLCPVFVVMGILMINILGIYLPIHQAAAMACAVPLIMFCTFCWMPESPVLLMAKGQKEEAMKNLIIFRGEKDAKIEFERLSKELKESLQEYMGKTEQFMTLIKEKVNRKALFIALGLRSVQQLCGSTAITFYCKTIFEETRGFVSPNTGTILYFSLQAVLAVLSSLVVDVLGRRPMFIFSLFGTVVTLFMAGAYMFLDLHSDLDLEPYSYVPMTAILLNVAFFSMGVRNVPLLVMSEVFSPRIKPAALCVATIYYATLAIVVTKFYQITNDMVEMSCPIFTFGALSFVCLVVYYFCVPETKGKTLEDIQEILRQS